jgi:hypothetical protein
VGTYIGEVMYLNGGGDSTKEIAKDVHGDGVRTMLSDKVSVYQLYFNNAPIADPSPPHHGFRLPKKEVSDCRCPLNRPQYPFASTAALP